jgi:Tfp pilus assembly ATPase PilU
MINNARIADLIRENRPDEISDAIDAGEYYEMQTFAKSLIDLVLSGEVEREIAANAATNRHDFLVALEAAEKVKREEDEEAARTAAAAGNGEAAPGFAPIGNTIR